MLFVFFGHLVHYYMFEPHNSLYHYPFYRFRLRPKTISIKTPNQIGTVRPGKDPFPDSRFIGYGHFKKSGHSSAPSNLKRSVSVQSIKLGDEKIAYSCLSKYNTIIHLPVGVCHVTLGSRLYLTNVGSTGLPEK